MNTHKWLAASEDINTMVPHVIEIKRRLSLLMFSEQAIGEITFPHAAADQYGPFEILGLRFVPTGGRSAADRFIDEEIGT